MLLTCITTIFTYQVKWTSDNIAEQAQVAVFENGIILDHVAKYFLAEKFINVNFPVSFPKFDFDLCAELGAYTEKLESSTLPPAGSVIWITRQFFRKKTQLSMLIGFYTKLKLKLPFLNKSWTLFAINSSFFIYERVAGQDVHRPPRSVPLAMMVLASVGLIGPRITLRGNSCRDEGLFDSCHDKFKRNAENIAKLADFTEALTEDVFKLRNEANDKFFMVTSELAAIKSVQKKMFKFRTVTGK